MQNQLGQRIRNARELIGMTQKELANNVGVKASTVKKWEEDSLAPRANRLQIMASILGVPVVWLLAGGANVPTAEAEDDLRIIMDEKLRQLQLKLNEINALTRELQVLASDVNAMEK